MSTWTAAVDEFGRFLAVSERSPDTNAGYLKHLGWLSSSVQSGPWELTSHELTAWLDTRNWSNHTRRKVLVSFRTFYAWAVAEGYCEWAPTAGLPSSANRKRGPARYELPPAWQVPLEEYLSWSRAGSRSEATLDQRRWWLGRLAEVAADPWAVAPQQLAQWLSNPDWAPETKRAARGALRAFYRWAVLTDRIAVSPADRLDSVMIPRALPRPAPDDAIREALRAADDRQRIMIKLAAYAGLRRAEIAGVHVRQISEEELLVVGKGGHQRRIPLHPDLAAELQAELTRRRDRRHGSGWSGPFVSVHGYLFPSDQHPGPITPGHVGVILGRCLPTGWTCHTLRHRFATAAYGVERDLRAVQELLGHIKPETTARYAAVPEGALRSAVAGVVPVSTWG